MGGHKTASCVRVDARKQVEELHDGVQELNEHRRNITVVLFEHVARAVVKFMPERAPLFCNESAEPAHCARIGIQKDLHEAAHLSSAIPPVRA